MSEQLMIDFDPEGTAARRAAEHARDAAYTELVTTVCVSQAEAREHGLWMAADDDAVTVHVCPACGEYEPNEFLITNNHGIDRHYLHKRADGRWVTTGREYGRDWCVALDLTSNHVAGESDLTHSQIRMLSRMRPNIRERFNREMSQTRQRIAERQRYHAPQTTESIESEHVPGSQR